MRKIFLITLVLTSLNSYSQNIYCDALIIKNYCTYENQIHKIKAKSKGGVDTIVTILNKYFPLINSTTTDDSIGKIIRTNPFFTNFKIIIGQTRENTITKILDLKTSFASIGNLNVTSLADGLAKFLVERVKQELSITFFNKFKEDLQQNKDLQILFPNTYNVLMSIDTEIYNFTTYIDMLREAFISDFQIMVPNFWKIVNDPRYKSHFDKNPKLKSLFNSGLVIANGLQQGKHAGDILNDLVTDSDVNLYYIDTTFAASVKTLNLFVQSLRSKEEGQYLVPWDSIQKNLINDTVCFKIYMGLIYQQAKIDSIVFNNNQKLSDIINIAYNRVNKEIKSLKEYISIIKELQYRYQIIENNFYFIKDKLKNSKGDDKPGYRDYYVLYDATLNFMEYALDIPTLLNIKETNNDKKDTYFFAARKLSNAYLDINNKRYASAVLNLGIIYQTLLDKNNTNLSTTMQELELQIKLLNDNKISSKFDDLKKEVQSHTINSNNSVFNKLIKYGNFAALIAKAETSDDVKNAIESVALPVGSSSIKRNSSCNISLNAYTGFYGGLEKIVDADKSFKFNSYGIAAPVGFAFSKGNSLLFFINTKKQWSTSLFVSVIDIGALAAFRFKNDTIAQVPTIQLKDIVSPGVFLSFGIPKTPISINLGAQMGPNLRKVNSETNDYSKNIYWRLSASVVVDIPIFNFYTKPK